ncbi:YetF domain-containing protein [Cryptosporangium arvum]|uniref:Putative membrane protein n=1 Tax=Cryptosporangium arvum DSM 44712 TaxID=927661 RepID=A0A010ZMF9_9ACTN|nr:YetF domain-containing protein [Cryptosporangium arvum]EXG79849.1 putative membrane protein [Cryptosporangium arvum DSM 44712]
MFALLTIALGRVRRRYRRNRPIVHGVPYVVVENGEPVLETMRMERLSIDDLIAAARQEGFERFVDIKMAVRARRKRIRRCRRGATCGRLSVLCVMLRGKRARPHSGHLHTSRSMVGKSN